MSFHFFLYLKTSQKKRRDDRKFKDRWVVLLHGSMRQFSTFKAPLPSTKQPDGMNNTWQFLFICFYLHNNNTTIYLVFLRDWTSQREIFLFMASYTQCVCIVPEEDHFWNWHANSLKNLMILPLFLLLLLLLAHHCHCHVLLCVVCGGSAIECGIIKWGSQAV